MARMLERFFPRRGRESPFEDDADLEQPLAFRNRDVGFVIPEAYEMEDPPELPSSPFAELRESMRERTKLCDLTWYLFIVNRRDGYLLLKGSHAGWLWNPGACGNMSRGCHYSSQKPCSCQTGDLSSLR